MNHHFTRKVGAIGILTTLLTVAVTQAARADLPGKHPHYLHARSDLRKAEQLLQLPDERNVKQEENVAFREVHDVILEIDRAAVLDRKDVDDNPPIDTSLSHAGKFREIERLLQSAKRDISLEEDNNAAKGWQHRALIHVDRAQRDVEIAAQRDHADDQHQNNHPHYLHARSDLRKAEQLLQLPDERNVKQEENVAFREVHDVILEIDRAAVLDRKDVDDNPRIDTSLSHLGKFREIERLLQSAKRDIALEEDNHAAAAWRNRAAIHLDRAQRDVEIAAQRDHNDDQAQKRR